MGRTTSGSMIGAVPSSNDRGVVATARRLLRLDRADGTALGRGVWPKRRLERLVGPLSGAIALLVVGAAIGGLVEAGILVVIARVATSVSDTAGLELPAVGPIDFGEGAPETLLAIGFVLLAAYALIELFLSTATARILSRSIYRTRRLVLSTYGNATWPSKERLEGPALIQLASANASKCANAVNEMTGIVTSGVNFLMLSGAAFIIDPVAALFVTAAVGFTMLFTLPLSAFAGRQHRRLSQETRAYAMEVEQHSAVSREVEVFGVRDQSLEVVDEINRALARSVMRTRLASRLNTSIYKASALLLVLGLLSWVVSLDGSDFGRFAAVALVLMRSVSYGQGAQKGWHALVEAAPWFDQLENDMAALEPANESSGTRRIEADGPMELGLDDVTFGYGSGTPVFERVTFTIEPGSCVGLVGSSGAGKSTLAELILGLRTPDEGEVRIDGVARRELDPEVCARSIAYVRQEPTLVRGSILDNVRFYRPWVSDEDAIAALAAAHVLEEARAWPEGLATDPGTLGNRISGGQKQRIALARALAGSPRLLVLDEPTSALDSTSERAVTSTIRDLSGTVTVVVVAHRVETLANCHRILEVGGGTVQEKAPVDSGR